MKLKSKMLAVMGKGLSSIGYPQHGQALSLFNVVLASALANKVAD